MNLYTVSPSCKAITINMSQEIVDTMTEHLQPKPLIITECLKFYKRNQASTEIVS